MVKKHTITLCRLKFSFIFKTNSIKIAGLSDYNIYIEKCIGISILISGRNTFL